jgi:colicin import membrane protein
MSNQAGRPGVSFAEVAAVADRITGRGERPTVRSVRTELGGGSLATIQRHFSAWKDGHRPTLPVNMALPPELQRAMLTQIERAAAEARAGLETELAETLAERDGLTDELERQSETLAAAEQRTQAQAAEIERHAGTIAMLERALSEAREQAARERDAAEAARRAAALAELRLEDLPGLRTEVEALRTKLEAERDARRKAEIEAAELRGGRKTRG